MMDGSLARFLVFVTDNDRPDRNRAAGIVAPPAPLLDALKAIIRGQGDPPPPGNLPDVHLPPMTASDEPTPFTVPMTAAAEALHEQKLAEEDGLLSWVRPGFRQRGVFAAIQAAVDADLLAAGVTAIRSWVVDGPGVAAMATAISARGGARVGEQQVITAAGTTVTYHEYLRPIREG
jgi:hypothetical protein